jgi:hypothetical protein
MSNVSEKLKEEFLKLIPPTIYFFVGLMTIALIRYLMLEGTGLPLSTPIQIAVAALIMGKAVLIADMVPFINRYPNKPLVYNITWKTAIYMLVATGIHYLERVIEFWRKADSFAAANRALLENVIWPHFWAVEIVIGMLVIGYCTFTELSGALGHANMRAILFTKPPKEILLTVAGKS